MLDRFPLDVIHLILSSLPDHSTLNSAVQLNKYIRGVFLLHSNAIHSSVAYNEVGPALPQACYFAILRCRLNTSGSTPHPDDNFAGFLDDLPKDDLASIPVALASPGLAYSITKHAKMLSVLENYYSQRYKNPAATTSSLSWNQSFKFTRALYRAWSYLSMFNARYASETDSLGLSEYPLVLSEEQIALLHDQQRAFLLRMCIGDEEKQQFCALISFLCNDLERWVAKSVVYVYLEDNPIVTCDIYEVASYLAFRQQLISYGPPFSELEVSCTEGLAQFRFEDAPTLLNVTLADPPSIAILNVESPHSARLALSRLR